MLWPRWPQSEFSRRGIETLPRRVRRDPTWTSACAASLQPAAAEPRGTEGNREGTMDLEPCAPRGDARASEMN